MLVFLSLFVSFSACLVTTDIQYGEEDIKMTNETVRGAEILISWLEEY